MKRIAAAAAMILVALIAGSPAAAASTPGLRPLTTQFPLGTQTLCCSQPSATAPKRTVAKRTGAKRGHGAGSRPATSASRSATTPARSTPSTPSTRSTRAAPARHSHGVPTAVYILGPPAIALALILAQVAASTVLRRRRRGRTAAAVGDPDLSTQGDVPPVISPRETLPPTISVPPAVSPRETVPPAVSPRETVPPAISPRETVPPAISPATELATAGNGAGGRTEATEPTPDATMTDAERVIDEGIVRDALREVGSNGGLGSGNGGRDGNGGHDANGDHDANGGRDSSSAWPNGGGSVSVRRARDGGAAYRLGQMLYNRGHFEGAAAAWRLAASKQHARAAIRLGMMCEERGDLIGARRAYENARRLGDPTGADRAAALTGSRRT